MVSNSPCPLTSMLPPSRTTRSPLVGRLPGRDSLNCSPIRAGIASSFFQSAYLAQALKCQSRSAFLPSGPSKKIGPESRVQTRSVGQRQK